MKLHRIIFVIALAIPLFGQSVVDEAKTKIEKQKHEAMVCHAKKLLERKSEIEAELAKIDSNLADLASGKDVKVEASPSGLTFYATAPSSTTLTLCSTCLVGSGGQ